MEQIVVSEFGGPEVLVPATAADPRPGPGQALLDVTVTGVLNLEVSIRRGEESPFPVHLPWVPGRGGAGVVREVGDGVDPGWVGRRVVADADGSYAERVVVAADDLVALPDGVDDRTGAALMHDGRTVLTLLEATPVAAGETALVLPAAGGLGSVLVQLLRARGLRVVGAVRGQEKAHVVRALGVDEVVDYADPTWTEAVGSVDVVFDGVGGDLGRAALTTVRPGGRFSAYGVAGGAPVEVGTAGDVSVVGMEQLGAVTPAEHRRHLAEILATAAEGGVRAVVGRTDPLRYAAAAHAAFERREVIGKGLLLVGGS